MVPFPIEPHFQLGITLYRCTHGCKFSAVVDLFGVPINLAEQVFASISRELIRNLFMEFLKMPNTEEEQRQEAIGFIEIQSKCFPRYWCMGWVSRVRQYKIKNFLQFQKEVYDFKHRPHRPQKRSLVATVNAAGTSHDERLLKPTEVFKDILDGKVLLNKSINLGDRFGDVK